MFVALDATSIKVRSPEDPVKVFCKFIENIEVEPADLKLG